MNTYLTIKVYSNHFSVYNINTHGYSICTGFCKRYVQFEFTNQNGRIVREPKKVYAFSNFAKNEFRFHINQLEEFKEYIRDRGFSTSLYNVVYEPDFDVERVEFKVLDKWKIREEQVTSFAYVTKEEPHIKLLTLQTGKGKTAISLIAIAELLCRFVIMIRPMYIDKWVEDILKTYEIRPDEILVIEGGESLKQMLALARENKITQKVIIISNKTIQNWYKQYERWGLDSLEMGYDSLPYDLFKNLKAGLKLVDEGHLDFHLNFKIDCYTHVRQSLTLTATMISNDPFIKRMHAVAFPVSERFEGIPLDKYIKAFAVHYNLKTPDRIKTQEFGGRGYSHGAVEKSIIRHVPTLQNYISLIRKVIEGTYFNVERPKKKLAVFASSIAMCTKLTYYFRELYPNLDVRRYVEDDPYENLIDADIRFTTIMSGGTAHDIPDLTTVIMTIAVDSIQSNVQTFGRLRKLSDCDTSFYYFVCDDIPKHLDYHKRKIEMFNERAYSFVDMNSGARV